jgi:hypothetical protein
MHAYVAHAHGDSARGLPDAGRTRGRSADSRGDADGSRLSEAPLSPAIWRDLARRVVEKRARWSRSTSGDGRDVELFVSVIAMADALRQGELEITQLQAELIESEELSAFPALPSAVPADRCAAMEEQLERA